MLKSAAPTVDGTTMKTTENLTGPLATVHTLPTVDTPPDSAPRERRAALTAERSGTTSHDERLGRLLAAADRAAAEAATGPMAVVHERRHDEPSQDYLDRLAAALRSAGYAVHPAGETGTACLPAVPARGSGETRPAPRCRRGTSGHHLLRAVVTFSAAMDGMTADEAGQAAGQPSADGSWRRFSELAAAGFIERTGAARPSARGMLQALYRPTAVGLAHLAELERPATQTAR